MKNLINIFRWIAAQSKAYIIHIFIILSLGVILSLCSVYRAILSKTLIDSATSGQNSLMIKSLTLLALLIILELFFNSLTSILSVNCLAKLSASIQEKIYSHIIHSNWQEQAKYHSGNLASRLTSDVDAVSTAIVSTFPNIFSLLALLLSSFVTLLYLEPKLGITAIIISPLSIFISRFYARKLKNIYKNSQEADAKCRSFIQESILNLLIIKTFCFEKRNIGDLTNLQNNKIHLAIKKSYIGATSNFILHLSSWFTFFLIFYWGAKNLSSGVATFGTLTALLQLMGNIQGPFHGLASSLPQLIAAVGSSERIMELLNLPNDTISDTSFNELTQYTKPLDITFNDIYFSYKKDTPLLRDISFSIRHGEIIGLVGSSGEGKTTIVRLLLSLINPDKGEILISNNSERFNISSTTRNFISYVPQGNTLFSGTIKDNLLYGNTHATIADIKEATTSSCSWDFINSLSDRFDTVIGEKGLGLSEGQSQRIAIARALLRKKPILILDEATSSLDRETEIEVLKAIQGLDYKPTCIIITHRPSALSICNRVLKLELGSLIELNKNPRMALETAIETIL